MQNKLAYVDDYTIQDGGNDSPQAALSEFARRNLGFDIGDSVDTYVDLQNRAVIHIIPEDGGE